MIDLLLHVQGQGCTRKQKQIENVADVVFASSLSTSQLNNK